MNTDECKHCWHDTASFEKRKHGNKAKGFPNYEPEYVYTPIGCKCCWCGEEKSV